MVLLIFVALDMPLAATTQVAVVKALTAKDDRAINFYQQSETKGAHRSSIPTHDKTQ